jgi:hypothetical protein
MKKIPTKVKSMTHFEQVPVDVVKKIAHTEAPKPQKVGLGGPKTRD